jgi:hypothetical protein
MWVVVTSVVVGASATAVFLFRHRRGDGALGRSVWLLKGPLRARLVRASALGVAGAIAALAAPGSVAGWTVALVTLTAAAWIERRLFFEASAPDRMPGGFH